MSFKIFRKSQRCVYHICSRSVSKKWNEIDMTYKELQQARIIPAHPAAQALRPLYDVEVDTSKKTTVTVLNNEIENGLLMVNSYSPVGFGLNNGISVVGPLALFPKTMFSWRVPNDIKDLKAEAFSLFYLLDPKIDVLVLGVGDSGNSIPRELMMYLMSERKMGLEIQPTEHAITTFNFLNDEGRNVAGAFYPPKTVKYTDSDIHLQFQKRSMDGETDADFSPMFSKK